MLLPDLLIVASYKNLSAYLVLPDGLPEIVDQLDYENDGQTSAPVVGWEDGRDGYSEIAGKISAILVRYPHSTWGLACPPTLAGKITPLLSAEQQAALGVLRQLEVENVDISNVEQVFDETTADDDAEKEHC
ncbi:MAG: hypothetical protein ABIS50_18690 [Luteolibacter sp.]|uniref:hypothetical protein n=1 Tax=Luteolibacter sp. TaxID=1962973 RepID=UPI003265DAB2